MQRPVTYKYPATLKEAAAVVLLVLWVPWVNEAAAAPPEAATAVSFHFRCEAEADRALPSTLRGVRPATASPGALTSPVAAPNHGSWQFDGTRAIAFAMPSNQAGFAEDFTWEGFFYTPAANRYLPETGIADRLVTQFAFDRGNWTRLAIGLVADAEGLPRLSVELEGFEGRTFGLGNRPVAADRWHHFALVHEGTASAARIRWYLDYERAGELFLGGQANQNTLRPPGTARFAIGARLRSGDRVDRGFQGYLDELRFSARPLAVEEFLGCEGGASVSDAGASVHDAGGRFSAETEADAFWEERHRWAAEQAQRWAPANQASLSIDIFFPHREAIGDAAFLRRLSLTVRGRIPTAGEVVAFLDDSRPDKRLRAIDRLLTSPEWADGWVGYWQDVLAENPSVVFPTLNNSGAFRQWIYDSFRENKSFDRFATELLLMEPVPGGAPDEGPAGFALATGNDAPMAMRAHVAMQAFAAMDLKCARCHDSPIDRFEQHDLFLLSAYLNGGPLEVPATSVAAIGKASEPGSITTTLKAGQRIQPRALEAFWLNDAQPGLPQRPLRPGPRAEFAALLTSPHNRRFSDVIVNRVWQRYFGAGLIEPVDRWNERPEVRHPELLQFLSGEFVAGGYDLKSLARRILRSETWQSRRSRRQRMSAEQLVDSLFTAAGKEFQAETLGVHATDPGAVQLPRPRRAWQFAALPNERDRPALGMPVNQTIVDVMSTFGWSGNRQQPRSARERTTSALQPLILFNGLLSQRIVRLSDTSQVTELCLSEIELDALLDQLFLRVLSRRPDDFERQHFTRFLSPAFERRRTGEPPRLFEPLSRFQPDWRKHLEAEQTHLMLAARRRVARGEPTTTRLTAEFRERVEDVLWALINSPEFLVIP